MMSEPVHQLWLYNDWANKLLLNVMELHEETLPAPCLHLFSHIVNTQMIWLSRINGEPSPVAVWEDHPLSTCGSYHKLSSAGLQQKIDGSSGEITVGYANTKNISFQNSLQDILLHIFNHGTYHRAQIATEMKRNGLEPVNTDYITFVRS